MEPMKNHLPGRLSARGFTLIELLTVLAIMGILAVATMPALQSLLQSNNVAQAGQTLSEQINLARQMAVAGNITVEVRLIQLPSTTAGYNAIQIYLWPDPELKQQEAQQGITLPPSLARMEVLPPGMTISQDITNYSKLLASAVRNSMTVPTGTFYYVSFLIGPSGMVQIWNSQNNPPGFAPATTMTTLYLTVMPASYGNTPPAPGAPKAPVNYALVQLNPDTGTTQIYRP
jgi:uncharacterized protein (TIGR02596 family)